MSIIKRVQNKKSLPLLLGIGCLLAGFFFVTATSLPAVRADGGNASFSVSPNSGSYSVGDSFVVTLYKDSGSEPVNVVEAALTYNPSHLQVQSVDASQSAFAMGVGTTNSAGSFSTTRAAFANGAPYTVKNKQIIVKLTLKALAAVTATSLTFGGNSVIASANTSTNVWNGQTSAASYTFKNVSPPAQPSSQPQVAAPPALSTPQSPRNTTITSPQTTTQTPNNATPTPSNPRDSNSSTPTEPDVQNESEQRGYIVVVKILDTNGSPVKNATVKLGSEKSVQTNEKGLASFVGIVPGEYEVVVSSWNKTQKATVTVTSLNDPVQNLQEFEVRVDNNPIGMILLYSGIAVAVIVVVGILVWLFRKHFRRRQRASSYYVDPSKIIASNSPSPGQEVPQKDDTTNKEIK